MPVKFNYKNTKTKIQSVFFTQLVQSITTQTVVGKQNDNNRNDGDDADGGEEIEKGCGASSSRKWSNFKWNLIGFLNL